MSGNTFGKLFKITTFGESHGAGLGVVIDGTPSNIKINEEKIQKALDRRRPGQSAKNGNNSSVTSRSEGDKLEILSGIFEGVVLLMKWNLIENLLWHGIFGKLVIRRVILHYRICQV